MFRFIIGLVSGIAIGVATATMNGGRTGQDIRAEFERIRKDLQAGDLEGLGSHLEERFKELQGSIEARLGELQGQADDLKAESEDAVDEAAETVEEAVRV